MADSNYALLGSGRLAHHFEFYLNSLGIRCTRWARRTDSIEQLKVVLREATHVLVALSDRALPEFTEYIQPQQIWIHFSGTVQVPGMFAAHPLMTFSEELQSADWYRRIPFIVEEGTDFARILPGLPNPHFMVEAGLRPLYHSLCALAGNSVFLLWKQIGDEFEQRLQLPRHLVAPFLHQVVENAVHHSESAFTGPVARQDWTTVRSHLQSLDAIPDLKAAYQEYLKTANATGLEIPKEFL